MALALNDLQRVDMPLNKETKPNQTVKWLQVLLCNTNNLIEHSSFACILLNGYTYMICK